MEKTIIIIQAVQVTYRVGEISATSRFEGPFSAEDALWLLEKVHEQEKNARKEMKKENHHAS